MTAAQYSARTKTVLRTGARAGLVARGAVYLLIGGIAAWGVLMGGGGGGGEGTSPSEGFRALENQPFGQVLVALIALGLLLYSAWRFIQGVADADNEGADGEGIAARAGMIASGISYLTVAIAAGAVLMNSGGSGGGGGTQAAARWLLEQPFGQILLGAAGLAMIGVGGIQIWRGLSRKYEKSLRQAEAVEKLAPICMFGVAGRGVLFVLIGGFLIYAAEDADPDEAMGAAQLMGWLREQPFGLWLYLAAAFALLGYAVYSLIQARYRHIGADV